MSVGSRLNKKNTRKLNTTLYFPNLWIRNLSVPRQLPPPPIDQVSLDTETEARQAVWSFTSPASHSALIQQLDRSLASVMLNSPSVKLLEDLQLESEGTEGRKVEAAAPSAGWLEISWLLKRTASTWSVWWLSWLPSAIIIWWKLKCIKDALKLELREDTWYFTDKSISVDPGIIMDYGNWD